MFGCLETNRTSVGEMRYRKKLVTAAINLDPLALAIPQVAAVLNVSPEFVRLEIRRENLRPTRLGSRIVIRRDEIQRYLDAHTSG